MAVILIAIGLLLTGIDIYGVSAWGYPAFHLEGAVGSHELSESIRTYTVTNVLGGQVRIDYLPDVIGCVLLLVGVCMLLRYNRQYLYSIPLILLTAVLSALLRVSGFLVQGPELVVWILVLYYGLAASELFMEYFVLYSTAGITDALVNRATNTRILFWWWVTVFCRVFITFLDFVGHTSVSRVYQVISILATIFYVVYLITTRKYVGTCEAVKIRVRRKREHKEKL